MHLDVASEREMRRSFLAWLDVQNMMPQFKSRTDGLLGVVEGEHLHPTVVQPQQQSRQSGLGEKASHQIDNRALMTILNGWTDDYQRLQRNVHVGGLFEALCSRHGKGRQPCFTQKRYFGLVPVTTRENDILALFDDCPIPFVVRELEGGYELVGQAYVHGWMRKLPVTFTSERYPTKRIVLL